MENTTTKSSNRSIDHQPSMLDDIKSKSRKRLIAKKCPKQKVKSK